MPRLPEPTQADYTDPEPNVSRPDQSILLAILAPLSLLTAAFRRLTPCRNLSYPGYALNGTLPDSRKGRAFGQFPRYDKPRTTERISFDGARECVQCCNE